MQTLRGSSLFQRRGLFAAGRVDLPAISLPDRSGFYRNAAGELGFASQGAAAAVLGSRLIRVGDSLSGSFFNGQGEFHGRREGANATYRAVTVGNGFQSYFAFDRCRGTFDAPTALQNGDTFGSIVGVGHYGDANTLAHGPEIRLVTTENWGAAARGAAVAIVGVAKGTTAQTQVGLFDPDLTAGGGGGRGLLQLSQTRSGARLTGLQLVNLDTALNTAVSLDFLPGGNVDFPLGRINAERVHAANGYTDLVFSAYNGAALTERARLIGQTGVFKFLGAVQVNNAHVAGAPAATGYITVVDSAGVTMKVLVSNV